MPNFKAEIRKRLVDLNLPPTRENEIVEELSQHLEDCHEQALGIGANSAIFSVVNTVLLRPLPYKNPEQLVMVWEENSKQGFPHDTPSPANFLDWRAQNHAFESMAAIIEISFNVTGGGDPE